MAWLVAGLGNPGDRYAATRHNLGRMVADALISEAGARRKKVRFLPAEIAEIDVGEHRVVVVTSTMFMNESGPSYAGVARKRGIEPANVIAVHDEIEIAPGGFRIKLGGGSAGHNGLRSLTNALGTPDYLRVRVGVGRPPGRQDPADFVLAAIAPRHRDDVAGWIDRGAEAVRSLIVDGLSVTQDRFNRNAPGD